MLQEEYKKAEELIAQLKAYVNTEIDLAKLTLAEKLSKVFSDLLTLIFVGIVFLFFVLFASAALAWLIGALLHKMWAGFLIVAVLYLSAAIVAWYARGKLIRAPVLNAIVRLLFNNNTEKKK